MTDEFRYYLGRSQRIMADSENVEESFPKVLDNIKAEYPKDLQPEPAEKDPSFGEQTDLKKTKTVFEYDPERGIMINPEDRQRNVSFRTDTFINMMGGYLR